MTIHPFWRTTEPSRYSPQDQARERLTGLVFLLLVPIVAHLLFSWMGMNPTDDGFFLGMGRRVLEGEVPHRDFITARPAGTGILWSPIIAIGGDYTIWISRFFVWFEFACIAWAWTLVAGRMLRQSLRPAEQFAVALMAFTISVRTFILSPFPAFDGLLATSVGLLFCLSTKPPVKFLGWLMIGAGCLFKQNFFIVGPAFMVILGDWRKIRYWIALGLPGLAYLAWMWSSGGLADFKIQLTSHTELYQTGIRVYLHSKVMLLGFLVSYVGLLVASGGLKIPQFNLPQSVRLWLLSAAPLVIFVPPALSLLVSWGAAEKYAFALFGMTIGAAVFMLLHRITPFDTIRTAALVLVTMWTVSISIGCNSPVLGGSAAAALLACYVRSLLEASDVQGRFQFVWRASLAVSVAVTVVCFGFGRSNFIYMDRPAKQLTASLGDVLPGGKMIRTNPVTYEYMKELHDTIEQHHGEQYAILPDDAIYWVKAEQKNPLPTSWPLDFELDAPGLLERFTRAMESRRGQLVIMVAKIKGFNLVDEKTPDYYQKIVPYVEAHFHKISEGQYWSVYE